MERDELLAIVRESKSDTLVAQRMREALGLPRLAPRHRNRHGHRGHRKKFAGMDACRKQKHGVRL